MVKKTSSPESSEETSSTTTSQLMWRVGMEFFSGILVGLLFGYGIDHFFHTNPWGMVIMILLGAAAGFRNIYKLMESSASTTNSSPIRNNTTESQREKHD